MDRSVKAVVVMPSRASEIIIYRTAVLPAVRRDLCLGSQRGFGSYLERK
jgi:hypothetical protein